MIARARPLGRMTVEEARLELGEQVACMDDRQVAELIDEVYAMARVALVAAVKERSCKRR